MWYPFHSAAIETDDGFETSIVNLLREIGDRGKPKLKGAVVTEGVPPARARPQAPALAPAVAPAPAAASAAAPAPVVEQSLSPSSFAEMLTFLREERQEEKMERQKFESNLKAELERSKEEMKEALEFSLRAKQQHLRDGELAILLARLETLHEAQLLGDDELHAVEDAIADSEEATDVDVVSKLIALSKKMRSDRAFARQLTRRKWA